MKVLHTIPYFNKASGGPVTCTYQLVKGLVNNSIDATILSFQPSPLDMLAEDKFINYLPDDRKTPLWLSSNMSKALELTIRDFDLVHINTIWTWPSHIPVNAARRTEKPLVISPHGMLYPQALNVSGWKKKIIGNLFVRDDLRKADCIHATSEDEMRHIRNYGIEKPIAVIPNCICVEEYPLPRIKKNTIRRIGFTGRLNPIKNIDLIIKAWAKLGHRTDGCELVIIGEGDKEYANSLKQLAKDSDINNITFTGFLSGQELKEAILHLDFQILPSKSENFGMVVAEALLCGVPVIASKGTPWKILEEKNCGWWVDADVDSLTTAINNAISIEESTRLEMGQRGRELIVKQFSSRAIALKMTELYNWLLGRSPKPDFVYED